MRSNSEKSRKYFIKYSYIAGFFLTTLFSVIISLVFPETANWIEAVVYRFIGFYLLIGIAISFIYEMPIFSFSKSNSNIFSVDSKDIDFVDVVCMLLLFFFGIYLLVNGF